MLPLEALVGLRLRFEHHFRLRNRRKRKTRIATMIGAPANSASVISQNMAKTMYNGAPIWWAICIPEPQRQTSFVFSRTTHDQQIPLGPYHRMFFRLRRDWLVHQKSTLLLAPVLLDREYRKPCGSA